MIVEVRPNDKKKKTMMISKFEDKQRCVEGRGPTKLFYSKNIKIFKNVCKVAALFLDAIANMP